MQAPFLAGLAETVIEQMGGPYPEIAQHREEIHRVLSAEEERFSETLERGMKLFEEAAAGGEVTGEAAFALQATYGFPLELTTELARERGIPVDEDAARELMEEHREISRAGACRRRRREAGGHQAVTLRRLREDGCADGRSSSTRTSGTESSRPGSRIRRSIRKAAGR